MKTILLISSIWLLAATGWMTDFVKATERAHEEKKLILLNFSGSDWCGPCIKMKREVFESAAFDAFAGDNLVLVRADFPRLKKNQLEKVQKEHNEALAERYNPKGRFPLTLLLDENGKVIHEWDGYSTQTPEAFINSIKSVSGI